MEWETSKILGDVDVSSRVGKEPSGPSHEPARASRAISYFRSLGSWEFGHGEPSHERATTKARLGSL